MRRAVAAFCAAVVAGAAALVACSPAQILAVDPDIMVTGEPGGTPTLTYLTPLSVESTYRRVIWPGTGPELADEGTVLLRYWIENGTTARVVSENYSSTPVPQVLTPGDLGQDLYDTLAGQRVGARLLLVTPPGDVAEENYPAVTVVDVLPTRAEGQAVEPRTDLPAVTLDADGAPSLAVPAGEPPTDLTIQPLIRGTGRQIEATDVVTVHYAGFDWTTGEAFDSTWDSGQPTSFSLADAPALAEGLVEQTTGSQVMLVVPPTYDLGATHSEALAGHTVVLVIDVLASGPEGVSR